MKKDFGNIMKQTKKLQAGIDKLQEELKEKTVEGAAGGGMVKVVANGKQEVISVFIEKEVVDPDDVEMLEDLVLAAVSDALEKSHNMFAEEMGKMTGNIQLPFSL